MQSTPKRPAPSREALREDDPGTADDTMPDPAGSVTETRPLGRGLEDVSHLFLSGPAAPARGEPQVPDGPRPEAPADATAKRAAMLGTRPGLVMLRPSTAAPSREQIIAALREFGPTLWEPLRPIATGVSCSRAGQIDLLAADRSNRLVIVDVDPVEGDNLLLRGIIHYGWVLQNLPPLRRVCEEAGVDFSRPPRAILVAPRFPPLFEESIRHIKGPDVMCVRYHSLDIGIGTGIFFERLDDEAAYSGPSAPEFLIT
jgi:hypothetical protein